MLVKSGPSQWDGTLLIMRTNLPRLSYRGLVDMDSK